MLNQFKIGEVKDLRLEESVSIHVLKFSANEISYQLSFAHEGRKGGLFTTAYQFVLDMLREYHDDSPTMERFRGLQKEGKLKIVKYCKYWCQNNTSIIYKIGHGYDFGASTFDEMLRYYDYHFGPKTVRNVGCSSEEIPETKEVILETEPACKIPNIFWGFGAAEGIYGFNNFDPSTMIVFYDDVHRWRVQPVNDSTKIKLTPIHKISDLKAYSDPWVEAIFRLVKDFDPKKRYMMVVNRENADQLTPRYVSLLETFRK